MPDRLGDVMTAAAFARESVWLFQSRGNRSRVGGLGILGTLALLQGDLVQARLLLEEVVNIATAVKEQESLSDWSPWLGLVTLYSGNTRGAPLITGMPASLSHHEILCGRSPGLRLSGRDSSVGRGVRPG